MFADAPFGNLNSIFLLLVAGRATRAKCSSSVYMEPHQQQVQLPNECSRPSWATHPKKKQEEVTTGLAFQYWNWTHIFVTTTGPGMIVPWLSSTERRMWIKCP
jgi:hypothetical protein